MPSEELNLLLSEIEKKYQIEIVPLKIGDKFLKIVQIRDFDKYVEKIVEKEDLELDDLPYWAKIWDSSFILAYFLGKQPVIPGQRLLEIGAGLGVVGVYAALCGHQVTITDANEDALLFARANVLLNGCRGVDVRELDWTKPDLSEQYEVIFGSEVVYERRSYPALVRFLDMALTPGGIIFLAKHSELPTPKFFAELTRVFKFKQKEFVIGDENDRQRITLYAIRRKLQRYS